MALLDQLLARKGKTREDLNPRSRLAQAAAAPGVQDSPEVQRVLTLPRRPPLVGNDEIGLLSLALQRPGCDQTLFPLQADALIQLYDNGFCFGELGVGEGKTLISGLAATLLQAQRPLLLIPKNLEKKTLDDFDGYELRGWRITRPDLVSHALVGWPDHEHLLFDLDPDLLIIDEAHAFRNLSAARTRRVHRFITAKRPKVVLLSGTMRQRDFVSSWHFFQWTHGAQGAPVPSTVMEARHWARAIDDPADITLELPPGALSPLGDDRLSLREGYREHVRMTPGVTSSTTTQAKCSIRLRLEGGLSAASREALEILWATGQRPDGIDAVDAQLAACEFQLTQGFWYGWTEQPPPAWAKARRNWYRLVREVLGAQLPGLDSPLQVATRYGSTSPEGLSWFAICESFKPDRRTNWIDEATLAGLVKSCKAPTVIWYEDEAVGLKLSELGLPTYGPGQLELRTGEHLVSATPGQTIACSINSCREGANLQAWAEMLVLVPPACELQWEQMIGRLVRTGQQADTVVVRVYTPTSRGRDRVMRAREKARDRQSVTGQPQRLCLADMEAEEE